MTDKKEDIAGEKHCQIRQLMRIKWRFKTGISRLLVELHIDFKFLFYFTCSFLLDLPLKYGFNMKK